MKKAKLIETIPFMIIVITFLITLFHFKDDFSLLHPKHIYSGIGILITISFYFFRFNWGVLVTSILILLALFNQISFYYEIKSSSYFLKYSGSTLLCSPSIQWKSFVLLVLHYALNFKVVNYYLNRLWN